MQLSGLNDRLDDLAVDDQTRQRVSDSIGVSDVLLLADEIAGILEGVFAVRDPGIPPLVTEEAPVQVPDLPVVPIELRLRIAAHTEDVANLILTVDRATTVVGATATEYERLRSQVPHGAEEAVALDIVSGGISLVALIDRLQSSVRRLADAAPPTWTPGQQPPGQTRT